MQRGMKQDVRSLPQPRGAGPLEQQRELPDLRGGAIGNPVQFQFQGNGRFNFENRVNVGDEILNGQRLWHRGSLLHFIACP